MIHDAVGVGGEVGYYSPAGTFRNGISIVSASLTGHINRTGRTSPFVSGGFSLATDLFSTTPGGHLAGGLNHWVGRRVAVRGEYRAHVLSNRQIHSVRAGLSLR